MKKIGIILATLVITMFFVGAVAAMPAKNAPDQREKFIEESAVQGVGYIEYEKVILDKAIAVDVYEKMIGDTGLNGSFAMTISETLNEGVRLNCSGDYTNMGTMRDPVFGDDHSPVMTNFECKKMIQFEGDTLNLNAQLMGTARYNNPGFHGGMNAEVTENYFVSELQKDETVKMTTTATYNETARNWAGGIKETPYNANELNFDTKNAFKGQWGTDSSWKKVCSKDIKHHQFFSGDFQVDKNLIFKEEVTARCPGKEPHGDC